ncbi:hypothetical protein Leryth_002260 [Lithospermum erythrorhizon]|uniref:DUF4228 domain-containing protein n=1 Tax=Lithospermum erythrorhizon TaxID=34254 RepID=A0AAV3PNV9_LITER|nr:hypothetical protein Leryth_002260 [Lithospermum erythrorhizon]
MGNCQAVDAAALVIQHPSGKIERLYWSVSVNEVMKLNPGHYVSLIIPLPSDNNDDEEKSKNGNKIIRFTRVKLLRPSDTLVLGRAYRLVTTQEVVKVLRAKKDAKIKKSLSWSDEKLQAGLEKKSSSCRERNGNSALVKNSQGQERLRQRKESTNGPVGRSKLWRPSLQSISESPSPSC